MKVSSFVAATATATAARGAIVSPAAAAAAVPPPQTRRVQEHRRGPSLFPRRRDVLPLLPRRPPQQRPPRHRRQAQQGGPPSSSSWWYPDWSGGKNVCLLNAAARPAPQYMAQQNIMKDSMDACCDSYYWWDLIKCVNESDAGVDGSVGGDAAVDDVAGDGDGGGSDEWYADYDGFQFRCVQDCPVDSETNHRCGGVSSSLATSVTDANGTSFTVLGTTTTAPDLHPTASECCTSKFPYLALGLCVASSEHDGSGVVDYEGSGNYYVDYENGRCVQDCDPPTDPSTATTEGICGGIVVDSSTALHANTTDCCATRLSYMDPLLCTTRSKRGGAEEGTFRLYPHLSSGTCVIDHDPSNAIICSIGYTCNLLRPTAWVSKLYPVSPAGVEECCSEGLPYVNPSYCRAKTMGIVSRKWFADYAEGLCHQDCQVGTGPSCAINADPAAAYYDTPEECCASKLGYRNQPKCYADSTGTVYEGTGRFYVDYKNSRCAQDCPVVDEESASGNGAATNGNNTNCGGVVEDASTTLHADATSCCAASLGYISPELCEDRSNGTATGTGMYYPIEEGICVKDTSTTPCPSGETCQRVNGWRSTLYDTVVECCSSDDDPALPASVDPEYCEALSTGVGNDKWFQHSDGDRCAKHCVTASDGVECAVPSSPSVAYHSTALECCASEQNYLNVDTCAELSEKGGVLEDLVGTDEYYVDWIRQACVKNCPVGGGDYSIDDVECGGVANGNWVVLHPNVSSCCEQLHYIDTEDCVVR